jgi:hypothetical protein
MINIKNVNFKNLNFDQRKLNTNINYGLSESTTSGRSINNINTVFDLIHLISYLEFEEFSFKIKKMKDVEDFYSKVENQKNGMGYKGYKPNLVEYQNNSDDFMNIYNSIESTINSSVLCGVKTDELSYRLNLKKGHNRKKRSIYLSFMDINSDVTTIRIKHDSIYNISMLKSMIRDRKIKKLGI